ncbi:MAG: hypothetical protein D6761_12840 [Candidatus Dadabacteria bacterium]|nr:MAG: hypothetical protein D6761_12840 [Candidatus Dadabacteria bacterium]
MTVFRRVMFVNGFAASLASIAAISAIYQFCRPPWDVFIDFIVLSAGILLFALMIQNLFHLRWLQRESVIDRWSTGDTEDFLLDTVRELLHFPYRSALLSTLLWLVLSVPAAILYWIVVDGSVGNALLTYSFLLAAGSSTVFIQDAYSRSLLAPRIEAFVAAQSTAFQQRVGQIDVPLSVRSKLILHSVFMLSVIALAALSAGYALQRDRLRDQLRQSLSLTIRMDAPALRHAASERDEDMIMRILRSAGGLYGGAVRYTDAHGRVWSWVPEDFPRAARSWLVSASGTQRQASFVGVRERIEGSTFAVVTPWSDFGGPMSAYIYLFAATFSGGVLLIFAIAFLGSHDLGRTVRRVGKWAEHLGAGTLGRQIPIAEDDGSADLIVRLDALQQRLVQLLGDMQEGAAGTRTLSANVQEHAVQLRQTTEEDANLVELMRHLLRRLHQGLEQHQVTIGDLDRMVGEAGAVMLQLQPALRDVDNDSEALLNEVDVYREQIQQLEQMSQQARDDLNAFVSGAEEARRSLNNLDDVLEHLTEIVRRSRQILLRTNDQGGVAFESVQASRQGVARLQRTMEDSAALLEHLGHTMEQLLEVASSIHDVAEDTKLLSLNAAIRSVKAREEGRSFSVISRTIQDLAAETQQAISDLIDEIEQLTTEAAGLDQHVAGLTESLATATREAGESAENWRASRSELQQFLQIEAKFEHFVHELRRQRDDIRQRQSRLDAQTQVIARVLGDLAVALEHRQQQFQEVVDVAAKLRNHSNYEVNKGRFVGDNLEQIRGMAAHIQSFLSEQARNVVEIEQGIDHIRQGMVQNVDEAVQISEGLSRLERAIRDFEDAFLQFDLDLSGETT